MIRQKDVEYYSNKLLKELTKIKDEYTGKRNEITGNSVIDISVRHLYTELLGLINVCIAEKIGK